jgi:RNA polymerase sigma-70 factor, ECF subfamily
MPRNPPPDNAMSANAVAAAPYTNDETDLELVRRVTAGDYAAFAVIMRRHNRALFRAARSILNDDAAAEDALQEAYLRAYQALPGYRGDSKLSTWLTRIAINQALEQLRKGRRERTNESIDNIVNLEKHLDMAYSDRTAADTPERLLMREQTRKLIERRIEQLPAAFRTVFMLRAVEDMPVEEVAACLELPEATVRTRFFRARRLLQKSLSTEVSSATREAFSFDGERCDRIVRTVLARLGAPPGT